MRIHPIHSVVLLVGLSVAAPAYAYVDPNSGGLFFQLVTPLLALAAASLAFAKRQVALVWLRLSAGVRNLVARLFRAS